MSKKSLLTKIRQQKKSLVFFVPSLLALSLGACGSQDSAKTNTKNKKDSQNLKTTSLLKEINELTLKDQELEAKVAVESLFSQDLEKVIAQGYKHIADTRESLTSRLNSLVSKLQDLTLLKTPSGLSILEELAIFEDQEVVEATPYYKRLFSVFESGFLGNNIDNKIKEFLALKNSKRIEPPASASQYLYLEKRKEFFEDELAAKKLEVNNSKEFNQALTEFRLKLASTRKAFSKMMSYKLKEASLEDSILLAQEALEAAKRSAYTVGSELALYLFGFKWFWGLFTAYSPTTFSSSYQLQLSDAQKALRDFRARESKIYFDSLAKFKQALKDLQDFGSNLLSSVSYLQVPTKQIEELEFLLFLTPRFFEEAEEMFIRDTHVRRKAHARGSVIGGIHRAREVAEEWVFNGFYVAPKILAQTLLTLAAKKIDKESVKSELSSQLSSLSSVGLGSDSGLSILLDFIVYMALEDISFFRFLDLDSCQKLLSWLDYEYLDKSGKYQRRYSSQLGSLCQTLQSPLKAWAAKSLWTKKSY